MHFWSGNKVRQKLNFLLEVKSLVDLFKGRGCGQSPQYFLLTQNIDSQTACCLRLEQIGESLCEGDKRKYTSFHSQRIALTMLLAFLFIMATACFLTNLVLARKQRGCLRLINCYIGRFLWVLPIPAIFEKIE